ncbi:MAG: M23 family metallopeptidase [Patescibacteria group bacterium]|nr:M23 family metallopeptidase [Patescibacteria group bacterium]
MSCWVVGSILQRIGTILTKFYKEQKSLAAAGFLLVVLAVVGVAYSLLYPLRDGGHYGVWGGPAQILAESSIVLSANASMVSHPLIVALATHDLYSAEVVMSPYGLAVAMLDDFGDTPGFAPRAGIAEYKVERGDTISGIAQKFDVSIETVSRANPDVKTRQLQVGAVLHIPAVSGVVYSVREGDSVESIADAFGVAPSRIREANHGIDMAMIGQGIRLIIPGASGERGISSGKALPYLKNYFKLPVAGYNWGRLHPMNAVDIAGVCGTPIVATAEGLVIPDAQYGEGKDGWNGGYGTFVLIEHPAGANVKTRYAHLASTNVGVGDYVKQGEQIGLMGESGDAAGCHVHFEVYGATNPFAK